MACRTRLYGICGRKCGGGTHLQTDAVNVEADAAKEEAKYESQSTTIITKEDIARKQAKSVEDVIFSEVGVTRTVDAMGRVGIAIRGSDPRHTLILVDGTPVLGDIAKYRGAGDEAMRLGAENIERIEIIRGASSAKYGADAIGGVVNIITKQAGKTPALAVNVEGVTAQDGRENTPFNNFFLRADAGTMERLRLAAWGGKRDILPIYAARPIVVGWDPDFRPSLRYFGTLKTGGVQGSYDLGRNGALRFSLGKEVEDVTKLSKHSSDDSEPEQTMRRRMDRDKYGLTYTGSAGRCDWTVDFTYVKLQENESGIGKWMKGTSYTGTNVLLSLNDIEHRQWALDTKLNIAASRNHLLTVGVGYRSETGKGSRIQDAPKSYKKKIRADDYDGSLYHNVDRFGKMAEDGLSAVHDYKFSRDAQGNLHWDEKYERYGTFNLGADGELTPDDFYNPANEVLFHLSDGTTIPLSSFPLPPDSVYRLYMGGLSQKDTMGYFTVNGRYYNQEFDARTNGLTIGEATLNKWHAYISDAWQLNKDTLLAPILRLDHSDLFGSHVTAGIGLTHNVGGDPHRRFKANLATGYAEPGMGELYYNWEMYSSMGDRPGWYWGGNSRLKPEKSVNLSLSLEGESRNTFGRVTLFHNRIKDYLTHFFTGHYLVLDGKGYFKDRLYSFRNLGSVTLTGIEAEVRHRFSPRWEGTLGYAYLQALNRNPGENGMPRRLLDRPRHKIDIGLHYTDEQTGWSGSLWADYYLSMLDSNAVDTSEEAQKAHIARYAEKSFGIWNLMVQKKLGPDALVYFGIDNLFAKRDDDRAFPGRRYRLGMNLHFDGGCGASSGACEGEEAQSAPFAGADWFIRRDTALRRGEFRLSGDYRLRHDSHTGEDRGTVRVTEARDVSDAAADILADRPAHGHAQRLRIRAAAGLGGNTDALVTGSTGSAPDVRETIAENSGMGGGRLERAELRRREGAFDLSLGRLEERIGVTGYFFGKDYDGARVVWTDARTQVRVGGGNFSRSTGIKDTAYTKMIPQHFLRSFTKREFLGIYYDIENADRRVLPNAPKGEGMNYWGQYVEAAKKDAAEGPEVIRHRLAVLADLEDKARALYPDIQAPVVGAPFTGIRYWDPDGWYSPINAFRNINSLHNVEKTLSDPQYVQDVKKAVERYIGYGRRPELPDGTPVTPGDITMENIRKWFALYGLGGEDFEKGGYGQNIFTGYESLWEPDDGSLLPLSRAPKIVPVDGYLLMRDTTPAVKNALYVQVKHMLSPDLGVQAHYMKSLSDSHTGGRIANVLGLGASLRLGSMAKLTGEWGRNSSPFARTMHKGSGPDYYVLRLDYGMPGSWKRGDWNAFFDYKRFEHGSFLGGNGTESLPDRYLDGIESFTLGLGCVPADNLRVELFYTFGARSTSTRETVFTAEKFKLGDFARVQITYKF